MRGRRVAEGCHPRAMHRRPAPEMRPDRTMTSTRRQRAADAFGGLNLDQGRREPIECVPMLRDDGATARVSLVDDAAHLVVDLLLGALEVVASLREIAPEEDRGLPLAEHARAEAGGHAPLGDHRAGDLRDLTGWRWTFLINVPLGILVLAAVFAALPRRRNRSTLLVSSCSRVLSQR